MRPGFRAWGITIMAVWGIGLGFQTLGLWEPLEHFAYILAFQLRQQTPWRHHWDERLAVIAIDEATLKTYGRVSDWDRRLYGQLLDQLAPVQPPVIGFDLLFTEKTPQDEALGERFGLAGNIVLATATDTQHQQMELVPALAQNSQLGHILSRSDRDGIPRQASLYIGSFPAFALTVFQVYQQSQQQTLNPHPVAPSLAAIPLPQADQAETLVWLNWPATAKTLPTYSFQAVVQGPSPTSLRDKIILVGVTAPGLDPLRTPFDSNPPTTGVFFQAALINNLLQKNFLRVLPPIALPFLLLALSGLTLGSLVRFSWQGRLLLLMGLSGGWTAIAFFSFVGANLWLPWAAPLGTILLTALGLQLEEQAQKQQLMTLFAQHLSPALAEDLWQRRQEIFQEGQLTPKELTVTVLFIDIRGFSRIAEQLTSKQLLRWLNRYFDEMTQGIEAQGGIIDKYIGDAIMVVFGLPVPRSDPQMIQQDALQAVATALNLCKRLEHLNQRLQQEKQPLIRVGIGIHTGEVIAGSIGGQKRLNYSVLGDTVNIAARLEALNKTIEIPRPYPILISETTQTLIQNHYATQFLGDFVLPGKAIAPNQPQVSIFTVEI